MPFISPRFVYFPIRNHKHHVRLGDYSPYQSSLIYVSAVLIQNMVPFIETKFKLMHRLDDKYLIETVMHVMTFKLENGVKVCIYNNIPNHNLHGNTSIVIFVDMLNLLLWIWSNFTFQ